MPDDQPVSHVTPLPEASREPDYMRWSPQPGPELALLLAHKLEGKPQAQAEVAMTARGVLGRGMPPGEPGSDTGLVVGYVQSGKTLSFLAVIALARDNGFQLIVVIAGSSAQLADQTYKRVRDDLRMESEHRRRWALYHNPKPADVSGMEGLLDEWRDPHVQPSRRKTIVLTVMKQHLHLKKLTHLLRGMDLTGMSALVIDDEADQASLNNQAKQAAQLRLAKESTTYRRLMALRDALPSHTYVQYTATPQAPLLISIIDSLSARWVEVLEPGNGYTGGVVFFGPPRDRRPGVVPAPRPPQQLSIVRLIPSGEIPSASVHVRSAPPTLQLALRLFMVGVATAYALDEADEESNNRSMLVHPSVRTSDHQRYLHWISDLFHAWKSAFQRDGDEARALAEGFRPAYDDLAATAGVGMPSFDAVRSQLRSAFNNTELKEVNRRQNGAPVIIEWRQRFGWILVGGLAMDRGFTVEGLTVTYMPRGLGGGNADTMQQRARFFGYKAGYLGLCRVFLERESRRGFEDYIEHEEFMRRDLKAVRDANQSLDTWPRRFVLDPKLKPCRDNVLQDAYDRSAATADEWATPQAFMGGPGAEQFNRELVATFTGRHAFQEDAGHADRTEAQRHQMTGELPLLEVVEGLLAGYRVRDPGEVDKWTALLAKLGRMLDERQGVRAVVYRMRPGKPRRRSITATQRVKQFFQGEYPVQPVERRGSIYPGDRAIFREGLVTVQVRVLDLTDDADNLVAEGIPFLAVRLPTGGLLPIVTQAQPGQPTFGGPDEP